MAQYIAATTSYDDTGVDLIVSTSLGVSCYGANGSELVGRVMEKYSDGTYEPLTSRIDPNKQPVEVVLTGRQKSFSITKKGTYKIIKEATTGTAGIDTEA